MEEQKNKIKGWRKLGIAGATISGLLLKPPTDIRIAIIVGIVAVIGILVQGILDGKADAKLADPIKPRPKSPLIQNVSLEDKK